MIDAVGQRGNRGSTGISDFSGLGETWVHKSTTPSVTFSERARPRAQHGNPDQEGEIFAGWSKCGRRCARGRGLSVRQYERASNAPPIAI